MMLLPTLGLPVTMRATVVRAAAGARPAWTGTPPRRLGTAVLDVADGVIDDRQVAVEAAGGLLAHRAGPERIQLSASLADRLLEKRIERVRTPGSRDLGQLDELR